MSFSYVDKLRFRSYKVLPLVYDNTLSYYETLCKVVDKINETVQMLNDFEDTYNDFEQRFGVLESQFATILPDIQNALNQCAQIKADFIVLEGKFVQLKDEVGVLANHVDSVEVKLRKEYKDADELVKAYALELDRIQHADIENKYQELKRDLRSVLTTYTNQVETLHQMIHNYYSQITTEYTQADEEIFRRACRHDMLIVQELIDSLPDIITVQNPVQGKQTSLDKALEDIYTNLRYYAIKAKYFDRWNVKASEFDELGITAIEFDTNGTRAIRGEFPWVINPFTGHEIPLDSLVLFLCSLHMKDAITAREFDNLLMTASEFDGKLISAEDFDVSAYRILTGNGHQTGHLIVSP